MDAFQILVIILASVLGVILLGVLIAIVIFIKIIKDIRHITEKAAGAADNIGNAAQFFKSTTSVAAITKLLGNAVEAFTNARSSKRKRSDD